MSVYRTDYLMWAVDVGADAFDWGKHEAELEGRADRRFDVVYDGMSGKYCMAGEIIAKSDAYEGFAPKKIDPDDIGIDRHTLARKVAQAFDRQIISGDFSLVLFSHYS